MAEAISMASRPENRRRRVLWIALAAALLLGGAAMHFRRVDEAWQEMVERGRRIEANIDAHDARRPVLWGRTGEGDAWPDYERALAAIAATDVEERWRRYRREQLHGDRAAARGLGDALARDGSDALAALRAGAHRPQARSSIDWQAGFGHGARSLLAARHLVNLAVLEAHRRAGEGDHAGAAHALLDAMQLGGDLMRAPLLIDQMIGIALVAIASKEALLGDRLVGGLDPDGLAELATGMQILDDALPLGTAAHHTEVALFVRHVQGDTGRELFGDGIGSPLRTWRFGFSWRLMCSDHARSAERVADRMAALCAEPWPARRAAIERATRDLEASYNPMTRQLAVSLSAHRNRLEGIAWLRLARMAVAFRLGGAVRALPDPFGDRLRWEREGDVLRAWSLGADGAARAARRALAVEVSRGAAAPR